MKNFVFYKVCKCKSYLFIYTVVHTKQYLQMADVKTLGILPVNRRAKFRIINRLLCIVCYSNKLMLLLNNYFCVYKLNKDRKPNKAKGSQEMCIPETLPMGEKVYWNHFFEFISFFFQFILLNRLS